MGARILIVDYGVGNLYSVRRAVEVSGGEGIVISDRADEIAAAERVILPGVGAFADGMAGLRERGLVEPIVAHAQAGKPLLGICLGMQMLATASEEFGHHTGLDLIPGEVKPIPRQATDGRMLKVPFIGWTTVEVQNAQAAAAGCLAGHRSDAAVYLVHSFHVVPRERRHLLATYAFGGHNVTAAISSDNITGFQFHPEKSGAVGLAIMRKFIGAA
jgi:glutamine amidotransferase